MNFALHFPSSCSCPACVVATTPTGAANIASWNGYAAAKTAPAVAAVDADDFFDLAAFDPFLDAPSVALSEWPDCPYHGPHEAGEDGTPLAYCERCERRM